MESNLNDRFGIEANRSLASLSSNRVIAEAWEKDLPLVSLIDKTEEEVVEILNEYSKQLLTT